MLIYWSASGKRSQCRPVCIRTTLSLFALHQIADPFHVLLGRRINRRPDERWPPPIYRQHRRDLAGPWCRCCCSGQSACRQISFETITGHEIEGRRIHRQRRTWRAKYLRAPPAAAPPPSIRFLRMSFHPLRHRSTMAVQRSLVGSVVQPDHVIVL